MRFQEARNAYDAVSVARRDHALAAADYFKIAGRNFEVEMELNLNSRIFISNALENQNKKCELWTLRRIRHWSAIQVFLVFLV